MDVDAKTASVIKQETEDELHLNVLSSQNLIIKDEKEEMHENELETQNEVIEDENKMDIDMTALPVSDEKIEDPVHVKIVEIHEKLVHLSVDGIPDSPDDDTITLSSEEVHTYLEEKIKEHIADPKTNTLLALTTRSQELEEEFKEKNEEYSKLNKLFEMIYRNQEKFLRHMEVLAKIPTKSISISVDFPVLAHSIPRVSSNTQESLLKKDVIAQNKVVTAPQKAAPAKNNASLPVTPSTSVTKESPKPAEIAKKPVEIAKKPAEITKKPAPKPSSSSIECIDLTDETDPPNTSIASSASYASVMLKHPAPLPPRPFSTSNKSLPSVPPKPRLKVHAEERGIVLQWEMPFNITSQNEYAKPCAFDIFGYQEQPNSTINTLLWKKIGSVKAMTLPMACTLTQFLEGNKYHFAIRAMDIHNRYGSYSDPISIIYTPRNKST